MITPSPNINHIQHLPIQVFTKQPIGKRLVILGTADEGHFYHPTFVMNKNMAADLFKGGNLLQLYEDACTHKENLYAYLMRIEPNDFETAFSVLETFDFDLLYIHEMHFDIERKPFELFIEFALRKQEKGALVHAITTLSPSMTYERAISLKAQIQALTVEAELDAIETGKYFSLVYPQSDIKDAGAVYAGLLLSLNPEVSPVNKTILSFTLSTFFRSHEIKALQEIGIVCFRETFKRGIVCASSSCAVSTVGSVHKHIGNFRIMQFLINQIASELQPYIGKPHTMMQLDDIETIVNAVCTDAILNQQIKMYDYHIRINEVKGYIWIDIEVVPVFSIYSISTHTQIRIFN